MKKRERTYSGTRNSAVSERELKNREIAREAAAEGMVLLKNEGLLPLKKEERIALFGGGAVCTVKGGTGSGDVNEREVVSIYRGLKDAGFVFSNEEWLEHFGEIYARSREEWRDLILSEMKKSGEKNLLNVYSAHVFRMPQGEPLKEGDFAGADTALYVVSRTAGEAADRFCARGDYYLTEQEKTELSYISAHCKSLAVILNTGGVMDVKEILELPNLKALLYMGQPGMEGGHALADLLTGDVSPSGKLTDTWALNYEDYPNSSSFSHNNGNVEREVYEEGIYVGYRYFDSFEKETAYPFGFGLSYTDFLLEKPMVSVEKCGKNRISVQVTVENAGESYAGKEIAQVYISCPQDGVHKERRRLAGFQKTKLLHPGEREKLEISFGAKALAYFDEERSAWAVQKGDYAVWVGNSIENLSLAAVLTVERDTVIEKVRHICPPRRDIEELVCPAQLRMKQEAQWKALAEKENAAKILFVPETTDQTGQQEQPLQAEAPAWRAARLAEELTEKLTEQELISMVIGEVSKGQGQALGAAGIMVPGAAGETSSALEKDYDVPGVTMADGPAGLRLMRSYEVDKESGAVYSKGILGALEGGFFADREPHPNAEIYYQYCTAIPVGTVLAQSFNPELLERVGKAVAAEMQEFGVAWWLAPGMNIHRNPLCGRNFEYYSEDPYVSGVMAAAITKGVQSVPGTGATIKHFACNNQEDNRMGSDSILSERTLREIYLRGFEIAVKTAQPMAIMTSYNLINGIHTANSKDLCTIAAREEWGFRGIIMTDWTTTDRGGSTPWKCVEAGNDLIMPGSLTDSENIREALRKGDLSLETLKGCVRRLLTVIFQTLAYEDAGCYGECHFSEKTRSEK